MFVVIRDNKSGVQLEVSLGKPADTIPVPERIRIEVPESDVATPETDATPRRELRREIALLNHKIARMVRAADPLQQGGEYSHLLSLGQDIVEDGIPVLIEELRRRSAKVTELLTEIRRLKTPTDTEVPF